MGQPVFGRARSYDGLSKPLANLPPVDDGDHGWQPSMHLSRVLSGGHCCGNGAGELATWEAPEGLGT